MNTYVKWSLGGLFMVAIALPMIAYAGFGFHFGESYRHHRDGWGWDWSFREPETVIVTSPSEERAASLDAKCDRLATQINDQQRKLNELKLETERFRTERVSLKDEIATL